MVHTSDFSSIKPTKGGFQLANLLNELSKVDHIHSCFLSTAELKTELKDRKFIYISFHLSSIYLTIYLSSGTQGL